MYSFMLYFYLFVFNAFFITLFVLTSVNIGFDVSMLLGVGFYLFTIWCFWYSKVVSLKNIKAFKLIFLTLYMFFCIPPLQLIFSSWGVSLPLLIGLCVAMPMPFYIWKRSSTQREI